MNWLEVIPSDSISLLFYSLCLTWSPQSLGCTHAARVSCKHNNLSEYLAKILFVS